MSNHFGRGLGFQIRYEATNVDLQMNYRFGKCDGYYTTPNGTIESPSYPNNYPDNAGCVYTISQPTGTILVFNFHSMDIEQHSSCGYDYLEIRDGSSDGSPILNKLCGNEVPAAPILSSQNQVWLK